MDAGNLDAVIDQACLRFRQQSQVTVFLHAACFRFRTDCDRIFAAEDLTPSDKAARLITQLAELHARRCVFDLKGAFPQWVTDQCVDAASQTDTFIGAARLYAILAQDLIQAIQQQHSSETSEGMVPTAEVDEVLALIGPQCQQLFFDQDFTQPARIFSMIHEVRKLRLHCDGVSHDHKVVLFLAAAWRWANLRLGPVEIGSALPERSADQVARSLSNLRPITLEEVKGHNEPDVPGCVTGCRLCKKEWDPEAEPGLVELPCRHVVHKRCAHQLFLTDPRCPWCKVPSDADS